MPHRLSKHLRDKRKLYLLEARKLQNDIGWFDYSCDSLLFNSLASMGGVSKVSITRSVDSSGRFIRRPPNMGSCYPKGSKGDPSRDMILGLMLWAVRAWHVPTRVRQLALQQVWDTCQKGKKSVGFGYWKGKLGPGDDRTWLQPDMICTLAMCMKFIGMKAPREAKWRDNWFWQQAEGGLRSVYDSNLIRSYGGGFKSVEPHLDVLHFVIRAIATKGKLHKHEKAWIKKHHKRMNDGYKLEDQNAFFLWAYRRWVKGYGLQMVDDCLCSDKYFPDDRATHRQRL